MARVLVTGVSGQVGSYLAELLVASGHGVVGVTSRPDGALPPAVERAQGALGPNDIEMLLDGNGALDAVVHLASVTAMTQSWEEPLRTFDLNGRAGVALAYGAAQRKLRFVHASSGEIFGRAVTAVQDETTAISPVSPYGVAKAAVHMAVRFVRDTHDAPSSNLILYMTESPRRRASFVLRKIVRTISAIAAGKAEHVVLGNTDAVRDFSHARDVAAAAMLLALGATPGDYVCSSGQGRSIRSVVETVCRAVGIAPAGRWVVDPSLLRRNDIPSLVGDNRRLRGLGWRPEVSFEQLVDELLATENADVTR